VRGVGFAGLGVPLAPAQRGGVGRLAEVRGDPGRGQFLGDIPPPGAPLHREGDVGTAGEPGQPGPQVHPVGRGDLAALDLPGHRVEIVERQLLPVNIQPAHDAHRDLLTLRRGTRAPIRNAYAVKPDPRLSWGGLQHPASDLSPARCMSSN
jgi:hypothetical protein